MILRCFVVCSLFLLAASPGVAQKEIFNQEWPASWIRASTGPEKDFGVFYFRHRFQLNELPDSFWVHTSGDNRYQLYVNGQLAVWGPQRGDLNHWKYETTNIARLLNKGENTLAAVVWNYGAYPPDPQFSVQTAFLLAAADRRFRQINTGTGWKAVYDPSYSPIPTDRTQVSGYFGAGATERWKASEKWWNWHTPSYTDDQWLAATVIEGAKARTCIWAGRWKLEPRDIQMEKMEWQRFAKVRIADGVELPVDFPNRPHPFTIPPQRSVRLVFDMGVTTTAFPRMEISGGKGAFIQMKYVEAPYESDGARTRQKGNRNEVAGKEFLGVYDEWFPDGGNDRYHQPLWWRAFRYVVVTIQTADMPLVFQDYRSLFVTYPFETKARLSVSGKHLPVDSSVIANMLEVGERTVRLCSHETFMDCPYYEQTQFEGDSRVQALITYYQFGNADLARNAITQFDWSRNELGLLSARYPANSSYYIPNFSIFWIGMLYDYMMHVGDRPFITGKIQGLRRTLQYFLERQRADGTVRRPEFHNFVDWSLPKGEAPFDSLGYSALVDLHLLMALQWAVKLEAFAAGGNDSLSVQYVKMYQSRIERLKQSVRNLYYRPREGLFADNLLTDRFSVHTNAMAVLCGVVEKQQAMAVLRRALTKKDLTQPTIYWHFYLFEALEKAGLGNEYLRLTGIWQDMLAAGCTTWPETGLQSRSECHAWGASPNYHLYKILLGVQPLLPGFRKVLIAPHPAGADKLTGEVPTPFGNIQVQLHRKDGHQVIARVFLPSGTTGIFRWQGKDWKLLSGWQELTLASQP
jgi:hypothetical protein